MRDQVLPADRQRGDRARRSGSIGRFHLSDDAIADLDDSRGRACA